MKRDLVTILTAFVLSATGTAATQEEAPGLSDPFRLLEPTVTNEGRRRVADLYYHVDWQKLGTKPSIEGTGSEDYNDAWGPHVDDGPYAGVPVAEGTGLGSRMTACRWHLVDSEPFTKSLRFVAAIGPEAAAAIRRIEGGE